MPRYTQTELDAFANFSGWLHAVGPPSERDFHELFWCHLPPPDQRKVLRVWRLMFVRVTLKLCSTKTLRQHLRCTRLKVQKRYVRRIKNQAGGTWNSPYRLFSLLLWEMSSAEEFAMWWRKISEETQLRLFEVFWIWRSHDRHPASGPAVA